MKTWSKEERYRVLESAEEIRPLHERIIRSDYRQQYHIQSVSGLLKESGICSISGVRGALSTG